MKCNYCIEDIIKYAENTISEESKAEIKKHIENCESCKKTYTALFLTEKFSNAEATINENFHLDIIKQLDRGRYSKKNLYFYKIKNKLKPALSIAACLAVVLTCFMFRHSIYDFFNSSNINIPGLNSNMPQKTDSIKNFDILEADNIYIDQPSNTAVINPCFGKKGPGEEYDNVIELPYGRLISILGRYKEDRFWFLATLTPGVGDKEPDTLFWINIDNLSMDALYTVTFKDCNTSYASMFNSIIVDLSEQSPETLRALPDESSVPVCSIKNGDLVNVLKEDEEWSLVRKLTDKNENFTSYTGWIRNENYIFCKPGSKTNQGFIQKSSIIYEAPDENSKVSNHFAIKSHLAPVVIESTEGEWTKIAIGIDEYMGIYPLYSSLGIRTDLLETDDIPSTSESTAYGWVKTNELITSFEGIDLYALDNPEIDKVDFTNKIRTEIMNWDILTLNAYDIGLSITLTDYQKSLLAEKLTAIYDIEFFDGDIIFQREAIYPFYFLELKTSSAPELGSYKFAVAGEDKLAIIIPDERYEYYDYLDWKRVPVRFIKVNREFVQYIKSLLPPPANNDKNNTNYLLNAQRVIVTDEDFLGQPVEGVGPQVYKCVRMLREVMGNEIKPSYIEDFKEDAIFKFIFEDSSISEIVLSDRYIRYNGKYYELKEPSKTVMTRIFIAYF